MIRSAALSIVLALASTAASDESLLQVSPTTTNRVIIEHPKLGGTWEMRTPEVVGSGDVLHYYPSHYPDFTAEPLRWAYYEDGRFGYDWTPDLEKDAEALSAATNLAPYTFRPATRVSVRLETAPNEIRLTTAVTNLTDETLHEVWHEGGCLQNMTEKFRDREFERTWIETEAGLTVVRDTERSMGIRCAYMSDPSWYEGGLHRVGHAFWGESPTRVTSPLVLREAEDGGVIAIAYENAFRVSVNSDEHHHCIHSSPYFGDLAPGQTRVRRGVILFGTDRKEVLRRLKALGFEVTGPRPSSQE